MIITYQNMVQKLKNPQKNTWIGLKKKKVLSSSGMHIAPNIQLILLWLRYLLGTSN